MKKLFVLTFALFLTCGTVAAEGRNFDFTFKLGPAIYLNNLSGEAKQISAPSPVVFMPSFGANIPIKKNFSIEPTLSFFYTYFQWADGMAVPAEIENRTATTLSFLLDVPVMYSLYFEKSKIQITLGPAALFRFGLLAGGVSGSDYGYSGSAAEDLKLINSYFYSKARFFYLSTSFAWMYSFYKTTKFGPYLEAYFPIGSLIAAEGINGMMMTTGLKVSF